MDNKLNGDVAIVTGGNSGIGEATAHLLAKEGAKVALLARREKEGKKVESAIKASGGEATFFQCDVAESRQVDEVVNNVVSTYGKISVLFNNAGGGDKGNFPNETDEGWERVIAVNLNGIGLYWLRHLDSLATFDQIS